MQSLYLQPNLYDSSYDISGAAPFSPDDVSGRSGQGEATEHRLSLPDKVLELDDTSIGQNDSSATTRW